MQVTEHAPDLISTKTHFQVLDGMRGIAAVAVVIYHFMEIAVPDYTENFIAHGHLAVDFFFCLSGFCNCFRLRQKDSKNWNDAVPGFEAYPPAATCIHWCRVGSVDLYV
jgi:peptidoglycan/LPS O-acetylase OafA/YrhL